MRPAAIHSAGVWRRTEVEQLLGRPVSRAWWAWWGLLGAAGRWMRRRERQLAAWRRRALDRVLERRSDDA